MKCLKKMLCLLLCLIIAFGTTASTAMAATSVKEPTENSVEVNIEFSVLDIFEPIIDFFRSIIDWFRGLFNGSGTSGLSVNISQNNFETTNSRITLSGTYKTDRALKNITYSVLAYSDDENSSVENGEAIIDGNNWTAEVQLKPDVNEITVTIVNVDGKTACDSIDVTYDAGSVYVPSADSVRVDSQSGLSYVSDIVVVVFEENVLESRKEEIIASVDGTVVGQLNGVNQYQLQVPTSTLSQLKSKVNALENFSEVAFAHYDNVYYDLESAVAPSDPWDDTVDAADWLDSDIDGSNWWLEAIEAPAAWSYNDRFSNIKIGIVDNGFDTGHEDLNIKFPSKETKNVNSKEDHGTHVAGIIGAKNNNNKGITGIVWNSELICVDWKPSTFQYWKTDTMIAAGLIWTVESGAKVVNFSLGCSSNLANDAERYDQSIIDESGKNSSGYMASLLKYYDFIVVQSAGNGAKNEIGVDAINNLWFCAVTSSNCADFGTGRASKQGILDRILVVAATTKMSTNELKRYSSLTSFSNGGTQVDIAAPGSNVYSTITGGMRGSYGNMSGTSMAAPIVTGVCALVWSVNESFAGDEVTEIVCSSTSNISLDNATSTYTTGNFPLVNAKLAVEEAVKRTDASGTVSGRFVDATTGNTVSNVKVTLTKYVGYGNPQINIGDEYEIVSGSFRKELPAGMYTFGVRAYGYINKNVSFTVTANETTLLGNIALSTGLVNNSVRVVLRWGNDHPADLDSHFIGEKKDGSRYHVYYSSMGEKGVAWLDIDDTDYEGPETVTIAMDNFDEFTYCVHNYSEKYAESDDPQALSLATSEATVEVYSGDDLVAFYSVPTNRKGTVWKVFSMSSNGTISEINTFEYESEPADVGR